MPAVAISGKDILVEVEISAAFTEIPRYTSVNFGSIASERIETTTLRSDGKEYIAGLVDFGEVTINGQFDPNDATQEYLLAAVGGGSSQTGTEDFRVTWPTTPSKVWTFAAIVEAMDINGGDQATAASYTLRLKPSGAITRT